MSLRHGITAPEENKLKTLVSKGVSWEEVAARCALVDDKGREQTPLLQDVDMKAAKTVFDALVKKHEEAKKAGHKDLHSYERAIAKKRAEALAERKAKEGQE